MLARLFLVISLLGVPFAQAAAPIDAVYAGINDLRINQCQTGDISNSVLAVSLELEEAARRRASGEPLYEAISASAVQFSSAEVLVVGGDLRIALARLASRYCEKIGDAGFTHIGAVFLKNRWWVVLGSMAESTPALDGSVLASATVPEAIGHQLFE